MQDVDVAFPSPCGERWEGMEKRGCNRHCSACDTEIHDLSQLAFDEAEALLDRPGKVCVRAAIGGDGTVALADRGNGAGRRLRAIVGASMALAVAACQTTSVTPLYEISGQADAAMSIHIVGDNGEFRSARSDRRDGSFRFRNLPAGTYTLTTWAGCGGEELKVEGIVIGDTTGDADIGTVEGVDGGCIIVGVFQRANPRTRG